METTEQQDCTDQAQRVAGLKGRLAKALSDAGYYARLVEDSAARLHSLNAAPLLGESHANLKTVLEEQHRILIESQHQATQTAWLLQAEIDQVKGRHLSVFQRQDLAISAWKDLQRQIEVAETGAPIDPMVMAELIEMRGMLEKHIWKAEYDMTLDLLLTHEAWITLKPLIDAVCAAGVLAGTTAYFEHFLVVVLAGADGIRPDVNRMLDVQNQLADQLGIHV